MASSRGSRILGIFYLVLAAGSFAVSGCGPAEMLDVPEQLIGTWHTDATGYEKSYLKIDSDRIIIGMGQFELYVYAIEGIREATDQSGAQIVELHYTADEGYADKLVFVVDRITPNTFTLGSRSQTWVRDS